MINAQKEKLCNPAFKFKTMDGIIDLQIPLTVHDINGKEVPYTEKQIKSDSYFVHEKTQYLLPHVSIIDGLGHITLPRPMRNNLFVSLSLYHE